MHWSTGTETDCGGVLTGPTWPDPTPAPKEPETQPLAGSVLASAAEVANPSDAAVAASTRTALLAFTASLPPSLAPMGGSRTPE